MKNINILLFFFLCFFNIINFCITTSKQNSNNNNAKNEANKEFRKKSDKKIFFKRKFHNKKQSGRKLAVDTPDGYPKEVELTFLPLKILIDTKELYESCPDELKGYRRNIYDAMVNAQKILEDLLIIGVDPETVPNFFEGSTSTFTNHFEIRYSNSYLDSPFHITDNYNYFIFGKFIENDGQNNLIGDTSSLILDGYWGVPLIGIILFNKNIDKSKLNSDYLEPLMLHHFLRLLGFDYNIIDIDNEDDKYRLNREEYRTVIDYARNYFDCQNINSITLSDENEGKYFPTREDLIALYWPKIPFSGELLTKFDNSKEDFLSGFTLAFLNDLPYIRFKKGYSEVLTRFGNNIGYKCNCEAFETGTYGDDFWVSNACIGGYFMAMGSSESETHCENKNNIDYYFLYNEESQIYKKCESEIQNCQKCDSKTKCTSCRKGYKLKDEDGKTICKEEGLSTGAIIGIVFGCVGFLAIIVLIIICILKKRNEQKGEEIKEKEEITEKKEGDTGPQNAKDGQEDNIEVINI